MPKAPIKKVEEKKQPAYQSLLINIWIFIPAVYYFKKVSEYALNLPYYDDYDGILHFLNQYTAAGFSEKLSLLVHQHNEHRILSSRLVYVLYHAVFGEVNFRNLIFIANLQLLGIFLLMIYFIRRSIPKYWNIAAFVTSLSLFDISNFENADFTLAGMQNYGVVFLFLLSLYFYTKDNKRLLIPAIFFQALCIFSSGNGMVASAFIALFAILSKDRIKMIAAFSTAILFSSLYFLNYTKPAAPPGTSFEKMITFFLQQAGAVLNFESSLLLGLAVLVILLISLPVTRKMKFTDNTQSLICILLFVLASMGTIALFRSSFNGIHFYSSRYLIYPHFLLSLMFIFAFIKLKDRKIKWPATIVFLIIMLIVYKANSTWGESGFQVEYNRLSSPGFVYPDQQRAKMVTDESCRLRIYCIDEQR